MLFKYRKTFGILRILLGLIFLSFPVYELIRSTERSAVDIGQWVFVILFFFLYAISAIGNGIKEYNEQLPRFNLLRFFEASMNGFLGIYLLILIFSLDLAFSAQVLFLIIDLALIISLVRDLRLISLQYYEKKRRKNNG